MARPPKPPETKLEEVIRIPVTAEQKRLITEAAQIASSSGVAAWAREVLLQTARSRVHLGKSQQGNDSK